MAGEYKEKGFKNSKVLDGGVEGWKKAGYPINDMTNISAEFPFESKSIEVNGSQMHYIKQGEGQAFTTWRKIIPKG